MKFIATITFLWLIAILATMVIVKDQVFSYLGPVYFVCLLGSILTVRKALKA